MIILLVVEFIEDILFFYSGVLIVILHVTSKNLDVCSSARRSAFEKRS